MIINIKLNKYYIVYIAFNTLSCAAASAEPCSALLASGKVESAVEAGRKQGNIEGLICAGRALSAQSHYQEAIIEIKKAESLAASPYEKMAVAIAYARTTRDSGEIEQAVALYKHGYDLAAQLKQRQAQFVMLKELGQILLTQKQPQTALERFTEAYFFAANDNERADSDQLIALAYKELGDLNHAVEYQLKSSMLQGRSGDLSDYFYATLELAELRILNKDFQGAQKNIESILMQSKEVQSDYWIARSILVQGKLELAKGDHSVANEHLNQALILAKKVGDAELIEMVASALK